MQIMRAPGRMAGGNLSNWQLPVIIGMAGMLLYVWWAFRDCGASRGGAAAAAAAQDTPDAVRSTILWLASTNRGPDKVPVICSQQRVASC